jgi:hypothetical protein
MINPLSRHPTMAKKKSKGVLEKMGHAVAAGAETVVEAGAKAIESVGNLLPGAKSPAKRKVAKKKASSKKAGAKSKKVAAAKSAAKTTRKAAVKAKPAKKATKPEGK